MGSTMAQVIEENMAEHIDVDPEIAAISAVYNSLRALNTESQARVLDYVARKLQLDIGTSQPRPSNFTSDEPPQRVLVEAPPGNSLESSEGYDDDALAGVSSVAKRWLRRSNISSDAISSLFSLGIDEIDLVAKSVPGDSKKKRMRNVFLLK